MSVIRKLAEKQEEAAAWRAETAQLKQELARAPLKGA